jgi:hypothetical protein
MGDDPMTRNPMALCRALLISGLALAAPLGGCASVSLDKSIARVGASTSPDAYGRARLTPLDARAHMETALWLLGRAGGRPSDIQLARSGFQTAARLAPDMWEPLIGLAACDYRLGEFDEALAALAAAVDRRGEIGDLALPLALVAYRAHHPELARLALAAAPEARGEGAAFLTRGFAGSAAWKPEAAAPGRAPAAPGADADSNVIIEAFMIRDGRSAASTRGLNLLDTLSVSFSGTLVNLVQDTTGASTLSNVEVTLPSLTYSLNLASRDLSQVTLEATPVVMARLAKTSKFTEGGSLLIVPAANGVQPIDKNVGLTLEVTPDRIGPDDVDLTIVLELSNITDRNLNNGARTVSVLDTDKTRIEVAARVPYRKAMMIGSVGSLSRRSGDGRSLVAIPIPGLSTRGSSATRRDVIALISVRRPDDGLPPPVDEAALAKALFGKTLAPGKTYGERPSDTPDPGLLALLARTAG